MYKVINFAGCKDKRLGPVLRDMIQTEYFRVVVVDDVDTVEICGALKVGIMKPSSHHSLALSYELWNLVL